MASRIPILVAVSVVLLVVGFVAGYYISGELAKKGQIEIIDDLGRKVVLDSPAQKVISLAAAATRTLYDLGAFDKLIGVDKYSDDPPEAKNKTIVDYKNPEQILSLEPDLVIAWWYQRKYIEVIESDVNIIYIHPTSIEGIYYDILIIGKAVGLETKALELISDLKAKVAYIESLVKNLTKEHPKPKVYLELYSPYRTVGRDTFTSRMIELAGGINIAANLTGYPTLSDEYIIKANPDVILYESESLGPDDFANRPGWDQITAVKEGRIYYLDRHIATASPRFIEGLKFMVEVFFNVTVNFEGSITTASEKGSNIQHQISLIIPVPEAVPAWCHRWE